MSPGLGKGEVWWVDLGTPRGHGQAGRRPAIVVADIPVAKSAVVIPMTTTLERSKFPHTVVIEPDQANGLKQRSVALVFQIRQLDHDFLVDRAGRLNNSDADKIDALLADLLRISK